MLKEKRLFFTILICNLFLALTVMLFQPLQYMLVNVREIAFPVWRVWWIQLLLSAGVAFILSIVMMILPKKAGRALASVSLGLGISFLAQSLLFNGNRPFAMNESWPTQVENVFAWFAIVLIIMVTTLYYQGDYGKRYDFTFIAIAWILIVIQAVNFTMLETSCDRLAREPYYLSEAQYEQYTQPGSADLIRLEGTVLSVSMNRGMPYLLKDGFRTEIMYEDCFGKTGE